MDESMNTRIAPSHPPSKPPSTTTSSSRTPRAPPKMPSSVSNINHLPDLCFQGIFKYLSTESLLIAGTVCTRWEVFCRTEARSRTTLTLLFDAESAWRALWANAFVLPFQGKLTADDGRPLYPSFRPPRCTTWNHICMNTGELTADRAAQLAELFPTLTSLTVGVCTEPSDLDSLRPLLSKWRPSLVELKIFGKFPTPSEAEAGQNMEGGDSPGEEGEEEAMPQVAERFQVNLAILSLINQMSQLKRLTVSVNGSFLPLDETPCQIDLPVLGRLEEYNFLSDDDALYQLDSLVEYAQKNERLQTIRLAAPLEDPSPFVERLDGAFLGSRFTQLRLLLTGPARVLHGPNVNLPFNAVTKLDILVGDTDLSRRGLLRLLQPLTALVHLHLEVDSSRIHEMALEDETGDNGEANPREEAVEAIRVNGQQHRPAGGHQPAEDQNEEMPLENRLPGHAHSVPSVKVLSLNLQNPLPHHDIFADLKLHLYFPKLQIVMVTNENGLLCDECADFDYYDDPFLFDEEAQIEAEFFDDEEACIKELVKPLRQCTELQFVQAISIAREIRQWNMADLEKL